MKPVFAYDQDCGFCSFWVGRWKRSTGDRIEYVPYIVAHRLFPQIPMEDFQKSVQLIYSDGRRYQGAGAVFRALALNPWRRWMLWIYIHIPGVRPISEWFYGWVSRHRNFLYKLMRFLRVL